MNFRKDTNLQANVICSLYNGDEVQVIDRGGAKQEIGGCDSYWYPVKRADDPDG